jgi:glycosyltransferase involved in cell wall biosynthesis
MNSLVSILIPAYNAEKWIRQSIQSALAQSYSPIEVIIVDDGSTDGTIGEIKRFGDRVTLIEREHAGANACRNLLTQLAQGEWLQFLDADDYLLPSKVSDQIHFLTNYNTPLDVVYSPTILRQEDTCLETPTAIDPPFDETVQFVRWMPFCTHGMLLRRSAVLEAGGWKEDQVVCQEHELVFRLITLKRNFAVWNQPGTVYRIHSTDTVSRNNLLRTMQIRMEILDRFEEWLIHSERMTPLHRREIYAARLDTARFAWRIDESQGEKLARKAAENGYYWTRNAALPLSFQVVTRIAGFRAAQKLAQFRRGIAMTRKPIDVSAARQD